MTAASNEVVAVIQADVDAANEWAFIEGRWSEYEGDFAADLAADFARHRIAHSEPRPVAEDMEVAAQLSCEAFYGNDWQWGMLNDAFRQKWRDVVSAAALATHSPAPMAVPDDLRQAAYCASDGPWEVDSEWNADGAYGGGPDHGTGYDDYLILDAQGRTLFGSENSTAKMIEEEHDEDGGTAWDQVGKRNATFIVAAVNYVRTLLAHPSTQEG